MINTEQDHELLHAEGDAHLVAGTPAGARPAPRKMGFGQKAVVAFLLAVVLVPPLAGFYSYFSGIPLHLLAAKKEDNETDESSAPLSISLVEGRVHTLALSDEVAKTLGVRKGAHDSIALAEPPKHKQTLVLPGSTALDPTHLARIRARFAPARVVDIAHVRDPLRRSGQTEFRELRQGDVVSKGDLLGVFYSLDVGSKKNDLLDALVQLELDQHILDNAEKHNEAVPAVFLLGAERAIQGDRNAVNRAINNLKLWEIPQEEIDALHTEAKKICSDKSAWLKTPEGRWVKGEKQAGEAKLDPHTEADNPWGRVTLRAPFDGVVVERNLHVNEMVVDNTVNLFQIADVSRLLVVANCPEDDLPALEALDRNQRKWTVRTVGTGSAAGLVGAIEEISYIIDPNQHTAVVKGYVENPGKHIRGGQYVTATVEIPPPDDVVEIPVDALVDDGRQSVVFVQPDADKHQFTMRRVHVTHRFARTVFVQTTPITTDEQQLAREAEEGLLPAEPLRPGERVLLAGSLELKRVVIDLESRPKDKSADLVDKARMQLAPDLEPRADQKSKSGKG
jgi:membrane fusion protein, heavy metal efflux system